MRSRGTAAGWAVGDAGAGGGAAVLAAGAVTTGAWVVDVAEPSGGDGFWGQPLEPPQLVASHNEAKQQREETLTFMGGGIT